jgi:RNA polymerase sigma-70 factor (sigma-E family)
LIEREHDFTEYAGSRWSALVRSAIVLGCDRQEAQDLVQNTLLRCFVSWSKVARANNPDAYVYQVLLNCFRDSRRRRWWGERPTAALPDDGTSDIAGAVALVDAVHRALEDLTVSHREVVVLRYYAQLNEAQMANLLGVAPGTVKSRLSRALSVLATSQHLAIPSEDLNIEGRNQ